MSPSAKKTSSSHPTLQLVRADGPTDGELLDGVHYRGAEGAITESISMRSRSGTVRRISARHDRAKLREIIGERLG